MGLSTAIICLGILFTGQAKGYSDSAQMLKDINAPRWQVRRDAFARLGGLFKGADAAGAQSLLIKLRLIEDERANDGGPDADLFEDDDYLAYDDDLTRVVEQIAVTTHNKVAFKALVYQRYNGDSVYGDWIASHRESLPYLQQQLRSRYWARRMNAVHVIAGMLAKSKNNHPFPRVRYQALKKKIQQLALNDVLSVRVSAIQGLGLIKDQEDLPLLYSLAEHSKHDIVRSSAGAAGASIRQAMPAARNDM